MKSIIEQAIKSIEAKRDNEVSVIKDRIVREKIAVYNADIDASRARALQEIDIDLKNKIVELQNAYEIKKQELVKLGEEDKKKYAETILASELAGITVKYDSEIAKLKAQLAEIKE